MKHYEAVFIFRPQIEEEQLDKEVKAAEKIIKDNCDGDVSDQILGKRTLAYAIKKQNEGFYVKYIFTAEPASIARIKDELKHRESILRSVFFVKENDK
jgi:small subunit ribosomal protein S6